MQRLEKRRLIVFFTVCIAAVCPVAGFSQPCMPCEEVAAVDFGPDVTISSAQLRTEISGFGEQGPFSVSTPEYCDVRGVIAPSQGFDIKLPTGMMWNSRLYVVGNSVAAGAVQEDSMLPGIFGGFATAGTDTGHQSLDVTDWTFGYNPPDNSNPDAEEKLIDYCDESIHETTVLAKEIIDAYYCEGPQYSYYVGCSTGGRQGLIEAQRYPEDFDGILVGAPVHYFSEVLMRGIWEGQQVTGAGAVDPAKLPILAAAVMDKCDSIDGLVDGLIDAPRACDFDARSDLPVCEGDVDGADCFTTAQRDAIFGIYDGPRNSEGELLTFGEAFGSESMLGLSSGWIPWLVWPGMPFPNLAQLVGSGFVQFIGLEPPPGYMWDYMSFDVDADWQQVTDKIAPLCDADETDLSEFNNLGGKLIHYDGWADQATGPYQTVDYYENVLDAMGVEQTENFYKLYMIPGMFHCGGGLGCYDFTALFTALVGWVENGVEPVSYTGMRMDGGRTRPMCPYPRTARYLGQGSIDDAASFTCAEPVFAQVNIVPPTIGVHGTDKFIAVITAPKDLDLRGYQRVAVVCEGALAEKVIGVPSLFHRKGGIYIAVFDKDDLINIAATDEMTFTVTAVFDRDGERISLEGSDTVKVVE